MKFARIPLVIAAAAAGGALGHFAFLWIVSQGFYALIVPGAGIGIAAAAAKNPSRILAVLLGIAGLGLGAFSEWSFRPFTADASFAYFVKNILSVDSKLTLVMIAAGGALAWWLPWSGVTKTARGRAKSSA